MHDQDQDPKGLNKAKSVQVTFYHPQRDVPTADLQRFENPSNRRQSCFREESQVSGTTPRSQTGESIFAERKQLGNSIEQNVPAARQRVATVDRK